ncbi:MAG: prohibitin family protein [Proteobacteria bacterium]|nr:prohibitin family protein [Pseudomonadota bacterium]
MTVIVLLLWPYSTKIIPTGNVGVFYRIWGGTVLDKNYGEGLHFFLPWNRMVLYDCRVQRQDFTVIALSQGGLEVQVELSAIYNVKKDEVPGLHFRVGPQYAEKLIVPGAIFAVRGIVGNLHQSQIYDSNPLDIQKKVFDLLGKILIKEDSAINLHGIFVRKILLPEKMTAAIEAKHEAEQNVYQERYKILQAYERYKKTYLEASTIRMAQDLINEGLTPAYLRYIGIKATRELAASPNAKLVIVGGKDGLPLLLNPDTLKTEPPESLPPPSARKKASAEVSAIEIPDLSALEKSLKELDKMLNNADADRKDAILSTLPKQLLENAFFKKSTDLTDDSPPSPLQGNDIP